MIIKNLSQPAPIRAPNQDIVTQAANKFYAHFRLPFTVSAYAPGRVEALGNHTDYNEGFVLSAAINFGAFCLVAPTTGRNCRLVRGDTMEEVVFDVVTPVRSTDQMWSNYVKGVVANLGQFGSLEHGFLGLVLGNVPLGAGLSSSAALEICSALALNKLYCLKAPKLELARIAQRSEHDYVGVKTGLLDQITSLFGFENGLVLSDFRSLKIHNVPMGSNACFLICNTNVQHALVNSAYNERQQHCKQATAYFAKALSHSVNALRDVSEDELRTHINNLDPIVARRAMHVISENARVLKGKQFLDSKNLEAFGQLMFASHKSSQENFENSCPELDFLVEQARQVPGVLGARLSGGGFGGCVVVLIYFHDAERVAQALNAAYCCQYGHSCEARVILPSAGAAIIVREGSEYFKISG